MKSVTATLPSLCATLCAVLLSACAAPQPTASAQAVRPVPAALQPSERERAVFTWHAIGAQIYECRLDKGTVSWVLVAPEADLFNQNDEKSGTHGAGPSWTALDGSKAVGTVKAKANGKHPADIPLLLLSASSTSVAGKMTGITSVQRLNTEGGNAQARGCETAGDAGKRSKEGYTADYVFFVSK